MEVFTEEENQELKIEKEKFLNFLKTQREIGEHLDKNVLEYLESEVFIYNVTEEVYYSSRRKMQHFDSYGYFIEMLEIDEEYGPDATYILFCEQEIEAYAKSYRIYESSIKQIGDKKYLVKVFEFKPPKI